MKLFQLSICLTTLVLSGCFQSQDQEIAVRFEKFHKNGKLKISGFKNEKTGRSTGEWKYYDINGQLKESGFFSEMEKNMENGIDTIRAEKLSLHLITQMVKTSEQLFRGTNV